MTSGAPAHSICISRFMAVPVESCSCDVIEPHATQTHPIHDSTSIIHSCNRPSFYAERSGGYVVLEATTCDIITRIRVLRVL